MTIRERIETHRAAGYGTEEMWNLWAEGNLLPADEVDARIEAAVAAERERCAQIAESRADEHTMDAGAFSQEGGYTGQTIHMELARADACLAIAAAIRDLRALRAADTAPESEDRHARTS